MQIQAKWSICCFLPVMLITALLLPSCENDLNTVKKLSQQEANNKIDSSKVIEIIYSDSAKVKARVESPLLLTYNTKTPYHLMPKGVKIYFYDKNLVITNTIVADSGVSKLDNKLIELHRNVVVTSNKGDVFRSDELIWDSLKKLVYSNKPWTFNKADGTVLNGTVFQSDESFTHTSGTNGNGTIVTKEGLGN